MFGLTVSRPVIVHWPVLPTEITVKIMKTIRQNIGRMEKLATLFGMTFNRTKEVIELKITN